MKAQSGIERSDTRQSFSIHYPNLDYKEFEEAIIINLALCMEIPIEKIKLLFQEES